jgi:chorismate synthase
VEIISGTFNGVTTGAPICLAVWNKDIDSSEYEKNRFFPRPGQADYTAFIKYGGLNDYRGGGRFSGRLTASLVMGGAVARKVLSLLKVEILAHTVAIGGITAEEKGLQEIRGNRAKNPLGCADLKAAQEMALAIEAVRKEGDSLGGVIEGIALNLPVGLGEPPFDTLDSELARAMLSIPAVKGVEFGSGFSVATKKGSENNDPFIIEDGRVATLTNNAGGILGGLSSGMPLVIRAAIKPTPSIAKSQRTVDMRSLENTTLEVKGRHDACIVPRAVVVVEAMMAVTICDLAMRAGLIPRVIK